MIDEPTGNPTGYEGGDAYYGVPDWDADFRERQEAIARWLPFRRPCQSCGVSIDDGHFCDDCEWERRQCDL